MVNVAVKSHAILGGGPFAFCVYKIEVQNGKESWIVYRRYSEFLKLYDHARHEVGNNFRNLGVVRLPTGKSGSFFGSFKETIYERVPLVNTFIQKMVGLDPVRLLNCVAKFIDMTNKGVSGVSVAKGKSNIIIECFLPCKHHVVSVWLTHLIVLTKDGYLYELNTMFDAPEQAINKVKLTGGGALIKPHHSSLCAEVVFNSVTHAVPGSETATYQTNSKLYIQFFNANDLANFLRNTSEFLSMPEKTLERGYKGPSTQSAPGSGGGSGGGQQSQGNTQDVLSSTYGL